MTPDSVHLLTRSSQMTLCKDEQGRVRRAYYGPRLHQPEDALENAADAPLLYSSLADSVTGLPNASGEYCICVTQADGALSLSLECQGWEVLELDDDREEAVFYGKDPSYPVRVEIHVRSHRESDTFLQWAVVRNEGKEGIRLHRAASAQLGLRAERYFVTSFRGTWGGESLMSEEEVARGHELALVSGTGTRTAQEGSPGFIISLDGPAREDSGEVVLGALAWSGNYRIWFRHSPYHYLFAGAGLDTAPAPYLLDGGGVFETPPLILTHSKNGKGEASRRIHCWARRYGLRFLVIRFFPQRCDFGFDVAAGGNDRFGQRFVFVQFHSFQNRKAAFHLHHFLFHQVIELGRIALGHDFSVGSNQNGMRQSARAGSLRNAQTLIDGESDLLFFMRRSDG